MDYFSPAFPNSLSAFTKGPAMLISRATERKCQFCILFIWNYTDILEKTSHQITVHPLHREEVTAACLYI